jgi:hypothetical protein
MLSFTFFLGVASAAPANRVLDEITPKARSSAQELAIQPGEPAGSFENGGPQTEALSTPAPRADDSAKLMPPADNSEPGARLIEASMTATPPEEDLIRLVKETFPEDSRRAMKILGCESTNGQNPAAYDPNADNAGPMQINRWWEPYFREHFGWSWHDLISNVHINLQAARVIYDDAGSWEPWECFTSGRAR